MESPSAACVLLMVSGGSDSTALLELCALKAGGDSPLGPAGRKLMKMLEEQLPDLGTSLQVLHVNHQLRGADSDADEAFVAARCEELGLVCHVRRVDVAAAQRGAGMEAAARELRYGLAEELNPRYILTAHTLDDRVETFLMRTMVGTGPGGLGSIPRRRGNIVRPLLDATRQELRDFLEEQHPGRDSCQLWREDATNEDGSNFRSRVRMQLMPAMRQLNPGFEFNLARTMDLIAEEDAALASAAQAVVYRSLSWDEETSTASIPVSALASLDRPMARRALRQCLLVVDPDARLESRQIERVLDGVERCDSFSTEVEGGIRVVAKGGTISMRCVL